MDGGGDDIFVYLGGEQEVPREITHAIIDPSVKCVGMRAFADRRQLATVIFHDGVEIVEEEAFQDCGSLSGKIKLLGVREIHDNAFDDCVALSDVEFGDKLELIGIEAFSGCSMRSVKIPALRGTHSWAFSWCRHLTDVEFGINLETLGVGTFYNCPNLERIAIPLKDNLFYLRSNEFRQWYDQFEGCYNLRTVDIVGAEGMHKTISSLLLESWKDEMNKEINRINQVLPSIRHFEKTNSIRRWVRLVIDKMEHYKAEHNRILKEHMTQLELAIWKAKLERDDDSTQKVEAKRVKIDVLSMRKEKRITSGADIIIKNVLPFLKLAEMGM